ncbi:MAG: hypothetical protein MPK06_05055 [Alphaproteobacteria bacterium]|nr:hypothetical protein [Alphaproteobacteria bacterium]MDA7983313.1 hypothetical protein [Alphaproteobacteria bacterium]MDA7984657.1 hypothetical protein [Alphaproteobacteria bacterium]MDA7987565.1 hypothetical protein [Alphaproteobacteria bacterium]MDA7988984.1 hypothetical protein [Alphaproteobacteria bacterium]
MNALTPITHKKIRSPHTARLDSRTRADIGLPHKVETSRLPLAAIVAQPFVGKFYR